MNPCCDVLWNIWMDVFTCGVGSLLIPKLNFRFDFRNQALTLNNPN